MAEIPMAQVVDRFRANLKAEGIPLGEDELQFMADKGYLKPVPALERVLEGLDVAEVPGFHALWDAPEEAEAADPDAVLPLPSPREAQGGDLLDATLLETAARIQTGLVRPVALAEASLARIAALDPALNVFQTVLADEAMAAARQAEDELARGIHRGPLHGIPVAVKDLFAMAGTVTTAGSKHLAANLTTEDATAVARLREAGAVIMGKTRMSEFAYSPGSNNDHYGPTRNPRALDRDTGGSSSGSAAAVASGMVFAALGTDTGGSIRIPASHCALAGLKPTFGRLSLQGGVPLSWSLDHLGPLARTTADAAAVLAALAGEDAGDPRVRGEGWTWRRTPLRGLRVGVLADDGSGRTFASEAVLASWREGLAALEAQGAELVDVSLPELHPIRILGGAILAMEAAALHRERLRDAFLDFGDFMRLRILGGFAQGAADYLRAQQKAALLKRACSRIFAQVDVLCLPTMPDVAPALGVPPRISLTSPFNFLGWPALSVPGAPTAEGLPVGLQVVGRPFDESLVLSVGQALERPLAPTVPTA